MFVEEAGVIRVANDGTGKRKYATLSIPESVALRVHERLGNQPFQATLAKIAGELEANPGAACPPKRSTGNEGSWRTGRGS